MLVIAAPGQGAQTPGFLIPWLELPGFADRLAAWSDLAGVDLIRAGTTADAEEIRDTAVAQPLLVASAIAAAEAMTGDQVPLKGLTAVVVGHSVGELAAGAIAGTITAENAMRLVKVRAQGMAAAAAAVPTSMTAVLGGDQDEVLAAIEAHGLTPANINGSGQIVAAGELAALAAFAASPPAKARLRPLSVAGAFHTRYMSPAVEALAAAAASVPASDPVLPLLSNLDGTQVRTGADWLERIVAQVSAPVRWDACTATMAGLGASALIELPPAGTLTGLIKRALSGVELLALKTPDDLAAARQILAEHANAPDISQTPEWRLLVAPGAGTFRAPADGAGTPGAAVAAGAAVGIVEARGGNHEIAPTFGGSIIEWLVEDGDPVSAGQPLLRLLPDGRE
jgi:[acyl-carrier-protein] S-malonyltransferase